MPYTAAAKNIMLRTFSRAASHMSLHSGQPGSTTELRGGGYARQRVQYVDPPSDGAIKMLGDVSFKVLGGSLIDHAGLWSSDNGGVLLAWGPVDKAVFEANGVYVVDSAKLNLNLGG